MSMTLDELIRLLSDYYDPEDLIEALEITTEELLEAFADRLIERRDKFREIEDEAEETQKSFY